jgi:Icc-related predicted phosphoesterase
VEVPDDRRNINALAIADLQAILGDDSVSFDFAVIGDPQSYYDQFNDVLSTVASDPDLRFAVVVGDLTDQGLLHEFNWYTERVAAHPVPTVSIIGNHDHLGNGRHVFEHMFGPRNTVFTAGGVRFILFDNVEWESDIPVDHAWLHGTLERPFEGPTIVFMHIQPTDVQLQGAPSDAMDAVMQAHTPDAAFMGHLHGYAIGTYPGGTPWATAPWARERAYLHVSVRPDTVVHELVHLP